MKRKITILMLCMPVLASAQVSRIDLNDGSAVAVETGLEQPLSGPADISVSGGKIYIPDLPGSRVAVTDELP